MEEVLKGLKGPKGLNGKSFTKKNLFNFLADIDLHSLIPVPTPVPVPEPLPEPLPIPEPDIVIVPLDSIVEPQCKACMKTFVNDSSLKRHHTRSNVCVNYISNPPPDMPLEKGIHLIIDELLQKTISVKKLECKYCNTVFANNGNLHKHFNVSFVCNQFAFQEFKKLFNEL